MTTRINASVLGYISTMTAGIIHLTDSQTNTPNLGTLGFGINSLSLTGGDGNSFKFNGADLYVGASGDKNVYGYSFSGTATYATKIVTSGNVGGNATISNNNAAFGGTPSYVLGSSDGLTYGQYSPANFSVNYATSAGSAGSATSAGGATNANNLLSNGSDYRTGSTSNSANTVVVRDGSGDIYAHTGSFAGDVTAAGDIIGFNGSDINLKTDVEKITNALDKLITLDGITFRWNGVDGRDTTRREAGVIAQQVREVLPEVVIEKDTGYLGVRYEQIIPLLIEAIKELNAKVDRLEGKV